MIEKTRILGIAGSLRKDSYNRAVLRAAAELVSDNVQIDIFELDGIPSFNQDDEQSPPNKVTELKQRIRESDAILFVTPEYNYSVPGVLKNAIDWAYKPFNKKAVAYVSYGSVGGARAVEHLRNVMVELQAASVRHGIHIGGSEFASVFMGQRSWDEVKTSFDAFVPDLLNNLAWWTNATKVAREVELEEAVAA